jgi:dolichyl-phosphate beta-glucosyltransferase
MLMTRTIIVIPCYNEAKRLDGDAFVRFAKNHPSIGFLFVNDGSSDRTLDVLHGLQRRLLRQCGIRHLAANVGKAEAVRHGCLAAFAQGAAYVGYWDADLATPLDAVPAFLRVLEDRPRLELVCGARVKMLGRSIKRSLLRHCLGRVFARAASWALGLPMYDTQCGAKLFHASPRMRAVFAQPLCTRWLLDVELLARLIAGTRAGLAPVEEIVCEAPLEVWHDQKGSKVRALDFFKALYELFVISRKYLRSPVARPSAPAVQVWATSSSVPVVAWRRTARSIAVHAAAADLCGPERANYESPG